MKGRLKVKVDREPRRVPARLHGRRGADRAGGDGGGRRGRRADQGGGAGRHRRRRASAANGRTRSGSTATRAGSEVSINAAAHVYHRIPYAWVHEEGATIHGQPLLWLPLSHAPDKIGRFRMTPRRYPGPLQFVRRAGKPPLLVAKLGLSRGRAKKGMAR